MSLERAYALPRVRLAVARLLLDFGTARPASVAVCTASMRYWMQTYGRLLSSAHSARFTDHGVM
jgi:hypothetical protein